MAQNFPTFRGLLCGAICTRTQAQFANDSGISAEHLNRMLNADVIHRPTRATLMKIASAAKNGITYQDLKDALDKEDPNFKPGQRDPEEALASAQRDFAPEFEERAAAAMTALSGYLTGLTYPVVSDSVADFMDGAVRAISRDGLPAVAYDIGTVRPYCGELHNYAADYAMVELSMAEKDRTASSDMMVYFTPMGTAPGKNCVVVQKASCAVSDIMDMCGMPPGVMDKYPANDAESLDKALKEPYYIQFGHAEKFTEAYYDSARSPEEKLMKFLFGQESRHSQTLEGFGFWLDGMPPKFPEFIRNHMESILNQYGNQPEQQEALRDKLNRALDAESNDMLAEALADYTDQNGLWNNGWPAAIAMTMSEETGFPFHYHEHDEPDEKFPGLSGKDCIMLLDEEAASHHIQREAMLLATCRYVKELGLKHFGDILFTYIMTIYRKLRSYTVRDENETADNEPEGVCLCDLDYSEPFLRGPDAPRPEHDGLYAVKLKDGRCMKCLYLKNQNIWIMFHKEWSHLIQAWCPLQIALPQTESKES